MPSVQAGTVAMPPPRQNYGALRQTAQEVDGVAAGPVSDASRESASPIQNEINVEELKRSYAEGLQFQVNRGRISATERSNLLAEFDKDHGPAPSQDQDLQEARELAAEARSHETEQARAYEIEGPER
jgi:hypothetical protein